MAFETPPILEAANDALTDRLGTPTPARVFSTTSIAPSQLPILRRISHEERSSDIKQQLTGRFSRAGGKDPKRHQDTKTRSANSADSREFKQLTDDVPCRARPSPPPPPPPPVPRFLAVDPLFLPGPPCGPPLTCRTFGGDDGSYVSSRCRSPLFSCARRSTSAARCSTCKQTLHGAGSIFTMPHEETD